MSPEAARVFRARVIADNELARNGPPTLTPGQRAYQDYFMLRDGVNSQGGPLPGWGELSADIRTWWEHAGVQPPGTPAWWKNKVFWFNALVLVAAAAEEHLGTLQGVLPGSVFAWVAFGLPVANKAIRAYQVWSARP